MQKSPNSSESYQCCVRAVSGARSALCSDAKRVCARLWLMSLPTDIATAAKSCRRQMPSLKRQDSGGKPALGIVVTHGECADSHGKQTALSGSPADTRRCRPFWSTGVKGSACAQCAPLWPSGARARQRRAVAWTLRCLAPQTSAVWQQALMDDFGRLTHINQTRVEAAAAVTCRCGNVRHN